jgi:Scavenger mRNA decapping enzyme C-term binding
MCRLTGQKLLVETPAVYASPDMQAYIQQELNRPCKRWVVEVLNGSREAEAVRLRTKEFVLLPDTERANRYARTPPDPPPAPPLRARPGSAPAQDQTTAARARLLWGGRASVPAVARPVRYWSTVRHRQLRWMPGWPSQRPPPEPARAWAEPVAGAPADQVNWLAIATEPGLQSLRDLRGRHLPMLRRMLRKCRKRIREETGVSEEEIMAYVHYPPSVYQLHVHFAYPYAQYNHRDVFRIHSLATVINNLEIDPDYYAKASLQVSLGRNSALHQICASEPPPRAWLGQRRKSI